MHINIFNLLFLLLQALFLPPSEGLYAVRANEVSEADRSLQEPVVLWPDLQTLLPQDLLLLASQSSGRKLVRFSNSIANLGQGPAELLGEYNLQADTVRISQNIYQSDGSSIIRGVGEFMFHQEHEHWHWEDFALYEVWSVSLNGNLETLVTSSGKVGYCLRDDDPLPAYQPELLIAGRAVYLGCGWQRQGISVGWMDTYSLHTPGQFVDLSGAPDGLYALRSTVDPGNRLLELDESNNTAVIFFTIRNNKLQVIGPSITPLPEGPRHAGCYLINVKEIYLCKD